MIRFRSWASAGALIAAAVLGPAGPATAASPADGWLPADAGSTWTYVWSDSVHAPVPTREKVTVAKSGDAAFQLAWTTRDQGNGPGAVDSAGTIDYKRTAAGPVVVTWASTPPPDSFPVLCAQVGNCANSLASTHYQLVWGTRSPLLSTPLLRGTAWTSTGGAGNDVAGASEYLGTQRIKVPAFPKHVTAAKVRTEITQAGALGDPYGSGVRTVWWVYGVGPVRIDFLHAGADGAVTRSLLASTNRAPRRAPSDANYFPLRRGSTMDFRWRNSKHLRTPSEQRLTVEEVANGTARVAVKERRGPITVRGSYLLSSRDSGVSATQAFLRAATRERFPALGPRSLAKSKRRNLLTPLDFAAYGFSPIVPADPKTGQQWTAKKGTRDWSVYGVSGTTRVLGRQTVRVPAGRFKAIKLRSTLEQAGFRYGSGTRTAWYAPNKGLVKLVFRHADGSTSTVERLR